VGSSGTAATGTGHVCMSISVENFGFLQRLMLERSAIVLENDKSYLAEARLARLFTKWRVNATNELVEKARQPGSLDLQRDLVEALAIHETFFFRDPYLQECLLDPIIPELLRQRAEIKELRIWCAACSTGQEAYSVAILLREQFPQLQDWKLNFIASDFSRPALAYAREGLYAINEVNRGLPTKTLMTWFSQKGLGWQVKPELRRLISFQEINLVGLWPELPRFDIVLLRNVMIYFSAATRQQLLSRLRGQMAADGFLLLGGSETLDKNTDFVVASRDRHRPCYRPASRRA